MSADEWAVWALEVVGFAWTFALVVGWIRLRRTLRDVREWLAEAEKSRK